MSPLLYLIRSYLAAIDSNNRFIAQNMPVALTFGLHFLRATLNWHRLQQPTVAHSVNVKFLLFLMKHAMKTFEDVEV
jgi:hypothetical protein